MKSMYLSIKFLSSVQAVKAPCVSLHTRQQGKSEQALTVSSDTELCCVHSSENTVTVAHCSKNTVTT